jgi:hypothetical protein
MRRHSSGRLQRRRASRAPRHRRGGAASRRRRERSCSRQSSCGRTCRGAHPPERRARDSGSAVRTPCPMSERASQMVTLPFGSMRRKALGANGAALPDSGCSGRSGIRTPRSSPLPATTPSFTKSRRSSLVIAPMVVSPVTSRLPPGRPGFKSSAVEPNANSGPNHRVRGLAIVRHHSAAKQPGQREVTHDGHRPFEPRLHRESRMRSVGERERRPDRRTKPSATRLPPAKHAKQDESGVRGQTRPVGREIAVAAGGPDPHARCARSDDEGATRGPRSNRER